VTPLLTQSELDALAKQESKAPRPDGIGHAYQRERIAMLAERCCQAMPGDLIEIGCYLGGTSVILAEIARRHGRKLICVDNFKGGDEFNLDRIEPAFLAAIEPWRDVVTFLKMDAHSPDAIRMIQERRYCFSFSDDGHDFEVHCNEMETLLPVTDGLVAVDDTYLSWVTEAIHLTVPKFPGWAILEAKPLGETWLVKGGVE